MSGESGVPVVRRGRAEIRRLVSLYESSGLGRSEFCRSHGIGLSTLSRHLSKLRSKQSESLSKVVERSRLVPVELVAPAASRATDERAGSPIVLLINKRRVEVGRGFDRETLAQLVSLLEKL